MAGRKFNIKKQCLNCKEIFFTNLNNRIFCSRACSSKGLSNNTVKVNFKCAICNKESIISEKASKTKKYCSRKCKDESQKELLKGEGNPNFGNHILKGIPRTNEIIFKIRNGAIKTWKSKERHKKHNDWLEKFKDANGYYPWHSQEAKIKSSKKQAEKVARGEPQGVAHGIFGYYTSLKTKQTEYYHSTWEHIRMQELDFDDNVIFWTKKHKIIIPLEGRRWYVPDFLIETNSLRILEEVKGYVRDIDLFKRQQIFAKEYCKKNNLIYVVNYMEHLRKKRN